jgi:tripartite-type tricarboxylate transporter receptor subunit TctC
MVNRFSWIAGLLAAATLCSAAFAQTSADRTSSAFSVKPMRLILPFPAGASSDMVGRAIGQKLSEQLGQNLVPDNRVGAGGNLAMGAAAKAPPDGYALLIASPSIALSPALYSNLTYDAERDLVPIARLATVALAGGEVDETIVAVAPALPLIRAGRVRPLAVLSERRVATLPDVPIMKEAGFEGLRMSIWYGLIAPAGMRKE